MTPKTRPSTRVVVALDPLEPGAAALEILRQITDRSHASLLGLFIEDIEILAHAQSRLAREVVLWGPERPLDMGALERQLRAQSEKTRRLFEQVASQLNLPHEFQVTRGEVVSELTRMAAGAEILVVDTGTESAVSRVSWSARMYQLAQAHVAAVLYAREGWRTGSAITVIIERALDIQSAGRAGARLASASNSGVTVLLAGEAAEHHEEIQRELNAILGSAAASVRLVGATGLEATSVCRLLYQENARALVIPAHLATSNPGLIDALLSRTRCALMVVES